MNDRDLIVKAFVSMPFPPDRYGTPRAVSRRLDMPYKRVLSVFWEMGDEIMTEWKRVNRPKSVPVAGKSVDYYGLLENLRAIAKDAVRRDPVPEETHYLTPEMVDSQRRREKEMLGKALDTVTKLMEPTYTHA